MMEGTAVTDIFATKGIEYLIVIGFLLLLIAYWRLLSRPAPSLAPTTAGLGAPLPTGSWFSVPEEYLYHQGHGWAVPAGQDTVAVGMDDFAQKLLGRPGRIDLPSVGSTVRAGERAWEVEIDAKKVGMVSPVDGEVVELNPAVLGSPELVCDDPYQRGWLMKVRASNPGAIHRNLLSGGLARAWMDRVEERVRRMTVGGLGILLPDGGFPVSGFARSLSPDRWDEAAEELLLSR